MPLPAVTQGEGKTLQAYPEDPQGSCSPPLFLSGLAPHNSRLHTPPSPTPLLVLPEASGPLPICVPCLVTCSALSPFLLARCLSGLLPAPLGTPSKTAVSRCLVSPWPSGGLHPSSLLYCCYFPFCTGRHCCVICLLAEVSVLCRLRAAGGQEVVFYCCSHNSILGAAGESGESSCNICG